MKRQRYHFWQHRAAPHAPFHIDERWCNLGYAALLIAGIPAVVAATMFAVHYLYDGVMWVLPT